MKDYYKIQTSGECRKGAVVRGEKYRITVLTAGLLRLEYSEDGVFEDRATQRVLNRDFSVPEYQIFEGEDSLEILTEKVHLIYDKKKFTPGGLSVEVRGNISFYHSIWRYGEPLNDLGGTARTLDEADGPVELEHGVISRVGYAVLDDSDTLLLTEDGWVEPRKPGCTDLYFFGYGHEYENCLQDFYRLTGKTPLIPRYALGNWWSRFYPYSEEEYKELISRFEKEEIPFSVAVIDIDWHIRDVNPKYGSGWTGYTWNRALFPEPEAFMRWLHDHNMKVTLNVHPAGGVQGYEDVYREMAQALGKDGEKEEPINFDISDPEFLEAYFKYLHHPNEEAGVDFWWIDWQQGDITKIPGLDPLWMLNHYHYLDNGRDGKRPMVFSRYAGIGSHRYPVGFSGDTIVSWESLDFQPYFTANASNVGYGWWSHDIGGHMNGCRDDELATRWLQFGVFSPIMRLHSSSSPFLSKEPWQYDRISEEIMKRYLRLRHEMLPYLYTMNYGASQEGRPLIRPMYYLEPEQPEAYDVPNEYYFGTELIACPVTKPIDSKAQTAPFWAWIPEGLWFDFFNGMVYQGGRMLTLYRNLDDIPVLAGSGAIVPMADLDRFTNSVANPEAFVVRIFPGKSNSFLIYEDGGESEANLQDNRAYTLLEWNWGDETTFCIHGAEGNTETIPAMRSWKLEFCGIKESAMKKLKVTVDGAEGAEKLVRVEYDRERSACIVRISSMAICSEIEVHFGELPEIAENDIVKRLRERLLPMKIETVAKDRIYQYAKDGKTSTELLGIIQGMGLQETVIGTLSEILLA